MKTCPELVQQIMPNIKTISIDELPAKLEQDNALLIDVREPGEFGQGHIDSAVSMPRGVLEMKIHQHPAVQNYDSPQEALQALADYDIYLICQAGGRSALATESLQRMGFENVYSVNGGMNAWQNK